MKDRIFEIIKYLDLKPTLFASETNINPATLSQILNGRNNPSLDVIAKIRARYPNISYDWLINGEGEMCKQATLPFADEYTPSNLDENREFATKSTDDAENRKDFASYKPKEHPQTPEIEDIRYIEKPVKKIREIKIFYDDGTYETFVPQK